METNKIMEYTGRENRTIMIVETGGVAAQPYKDIVDSIVRYCSGQLNQNTYIGQDIISFDGVSKFPVEKYKIQIPKNITKHITWFEDLNLIINISNISEEYIKNNKIRRPSQGGGQTNPTEYNKIGQTGKLVSAKIDIDCYAIDKKIISQTLLPSLYHELNHSFDNYQLLVKAPDTDKDYSLFNNITKLNYTSVIAALESDNEILHMFGRLAYYLFIPTEFNALVSSLYGELQALNSTSYKHDLNKTKVYGVFYDLKNNVIPRLEKYGDGLWEKIGHYIFNKPNLSGNVQQFKDSVLRQARFKCDELFKRMGKVATLWYDREIDLKAETKLPPIGFKLHEKYPVTAEIKRMLEEVEQLAKNNLYN